MPTSHLFFVEGMVGRAPGGRGSFRLFIGDVLRPLRNHYLIVFALEENPSPVICGSRVTSFSVTQRK